MRLRRTSGFGRALALVAVALAGGASGCIYGFNPGTGFDLETVAILPFENETTRLELSQELHDLMLRNLPRALGLVLAGEEVADAVVRGSIRTYNLTAPNYRPGANQGDRPQVLQREVTLTVAVEILDVEQNLILWDDTGLRVEGQFIEGQESEDVAKQQALDLLVQRIADGLQSNW